MTTATTPSRFGTIETYMSEFAPEMSMRTEAALKPLFDPLKEPLSPGVSSLFSHPHRFGTPKPVQAVVVECAIRELALKKVFDLCGEMGVGKSPMGAWIVRLMAEGHLRSHRKRASKVKHLRGVITCPNQLVKKWADHIERIVPNCRARICRSYRDLLPLLKARPAYHEVIIIPRDVGKLSYSWRPGVNARKRWTWLTDRDGNDVKIEVEEFSCPCCGGIVEKELKGQWAPVGLEWFAKKGGGPGSRRTCTNTAWHITMVDGQRTHSGTYWAPTEGRAHAAAEQAAKERGLYAPKTHSIVEGRKCKNPLWQAYRGAPDRQMFADRSHGNDTFRPDLIPAPGVSPRRCSPAEFIWRKNIRFDVYIGDESHELANESLQGQMAAWLCARSAKSILMTGTLTGGYATNLLHTLWRTDPSRMKADGLKFGESGEAEFVKKYGVLQTVKKYTKKNEYQDIKDLVLGRGKPKSGRVKVLPGISPQLFTRLLMQRSAFCVLPEMSGDLPPFDEYVVQVPLDLEAARLLQEMTIEFKEHADRMRAAGEPCRAWSAARACFLRWPDRPWPAYDIYDRNKDGLKIHALSVPELPKSREYPKELRLRRLVTAEKLRGRKCCVFTEMTGEAWDIVPRLVNYLESHGLRTVFLPSEAQGGPKPEDRDDWIKEKMRHADVLLANPTLVMTGLDLYITPTIIWYYVGYSLYKLRQGSRRAWRLGQTQPCKVFYLVYGRASRYQLLPCSAATDAMYGRGPDAESQRKFCTTEVAV